MIVHRLNERGIDQFRVYLAHLRQEPATPRPQELIDDPRFTHQLVQLIPIESLEFPTKFDIGSYLFGLLSGLPSDQLRSDSGLWSWLALWFLDQVCPQDRYGKRRPKDNVKYIAQAGDHRFGLDKHLLFFPWKMRALHGDEAYFLLSGSVDSDTREQREWTGYYLNLSTSLVRLCRRLYWNQTTDTFKRGARSTAKPGGLRRFVQVAKQLEVTYDITGMSDDQIEALLPREFESWIR